MNKTLKLIEKYKTEGGWRRVDQLVIAYTEIKQDWAHVPSGKSVAIYHMAPWGMKQYISHLKTQKSCKAR